MGKKLFEVTKKLIPKGFRKNIWQMQVYANEKPDTSEKLGKPLFFSLIAAVASLFVCDYFGLGNILTAIIAASIIFGLQFTIYLILYFKVDNRKKKMEDVLPDILQIIASNLQAGMTPYMAIKGSARKEFGPLAEELRYVSKEALGTKDFSHELYKIGERVDSATVKRTLKLISSSLTSGGQLRKTLEELTEDISETDALKKQMVNNTKTYTMFILFTIIVGAPLLLSISVHFVDMVNNMQSSSTLSTDQFGLSFLSGEVTITPRFLTRTSVFMLILTSTFATMLSGTITKGEMTAGLKYAPFASAASIGVFYLAKAIVSGLFAGMT